MEDGQQPLPVHSSLHKLLCLLLPEPPRCLYLSSLSKVSRRALPWLATLLVQSTVVVVPGMLWCAAGSKRVTVPGTSTVLHPSQTVYSPILLLCVYLLLAHAAVQYLKAARQREADQADTALKPESIVGTSSEWQEAWPIDYGQGIPQGDASSLPVDRSMQQPRDHTLEHNTDALFDNIRDLKQRLYGTDANVTIRGKRDLATAAAEIDRLCAAVGVPATDQISHTAKTLRDKLDAVRAEVG